MKLGPLFLEGWQEFNQIKWGLRPIRLTLTSGDSLLPLVDVVYMVNRRGQIRQPPLNPYLALSFQSTPTSLPSRLSRQWLDMGEKVALDMIQRGCASRVSLPPEIQDIRPWQWLGFEGVVRYTYHIDLPFDLHQADSTIRQKIGKASKAGYRCERVSNMDHVIDCLRQTEERQGFTHQLTTEDLITAGSLMGDEHFRAYVCYSPGGKPVSARVVLFGPGARTIDWVAGTASEHLQTGATQLLIKMVMDDVHLAGAIGFDFAGANLPTVSQAKANWGGQLVSFFSIAPFGLLTLARDARSWWRHWRKRG